MPDAKSVLVVDDDTAIRTLIAEALDGEGYVAVTAINGADALAKLASITPDAIILDLMMPVMDGRAFLAALRRDQRHARIPVLVLSAAHGLGTIAAELDVRACLAKPFDLDVLLAAIARLAESHEAGPRVGTGSGRP